MRPTGCAVWPAMLEALRDGRVDLARAASASLGLAAAGAAVTVGLATLLALVHRPLPWFADGRLELPFLYISGIWTAILLGTAFTGVYAWKVAEETQEKGLQ